MTAEPTVPQPLGDTLQTYFDPEAPEAVAVLANLLRRDDPPPWAAAFVEQWGELRASRWMSTETWYKLTGRELPDADALYRFLEGASERIGLP